MSERLMFRVSKGSLIPADNYTTSKLRARGYKMGDVLSASLRRPRNPGFHRLAHRIGSLVAENIDAFSGLEAHQVLKRIQLEGRIECEEIAYMVPGYGTVIQAIPKSLSYESMGEDEFRAMMRRICRHVSERYWPGVDAEQIEAMAESWVSE